MTLTFELKDKKTVDTFIVYMKEIYDYINIPKENLPIAVEVCDNIIVVFMTDEFFEYGYQFFIEQLIMGISGSKTNERYMMTVAEYFRNGSDILLMKPVKISK